MMICSPASTTALTEAGSTAGIGGSSGAETKVIDNASSNRVRLLMWALPKKGMVIKAAEIRKKGHHNWPAIAVISAKVRLTRLSANDIGNRMEQGGEKIADIA